MSPLTTIAVTLAGKELFKKVVVELYEYCRTQTGQAIQQWVTERQIETLYRRISQVRKVKTIWQVDKAVDLTGFYCDSHVIVDKKRKKIEQLTDFGINDNLLIQGIAGQGKSIFLRYLCSVELVKGQQIPIFLELRRITKESSLMDRIKNALQALGLSVDDQLFHVLASSGKILLLLDAFDEIPDDLKSKVLTDIEDLAARHQKLRIVITSRPYHGIQVSNHFTVVSLDNLQGKEYAQVIRRLAGGQAWAQALIDHIEKKAVHIKELLCTPLMVTLLVLSYKSYQQLPTKLSDFYDALFQTLLQRHDGTKPGFARQRGCTIDDNEYRQAFETLCILAKKRGQQSFSSRVIAEIAKEALAQCGFKEGATAFVDDIVKITCLIIRDGEEYRFIHKTVQEYYTASYVQRKPEAWACDFYSRLWKSKSSSEWQQEMEFLSEIDTYRYNRYCYLPSALAMLNITESDLSKAPAPIPMEVIASILDPVFLLYSNAKKSPKGFYGVRIVWTGETSFLHGQFIHSVIRSQSFMAGGNEALEISKRLPPLSEEMVNALFGRFGRNGTVMSLGAIVRAGGLRSIVDFAQQECMKLIEKARVLNNQLRAAENSSLLDGLV